MKYHYMHSVILQRHDNISAFDAVIMTLLADLSRCHIIKNLKTDILEEHQPNALVGVT